MRTKEIHFFQINALICFKLNDGEIGIFYYNGNAYCKKLLCNKKGTYLISLNDKYEPIEIAEGETFKTFGRVVS